ncbi:hypothetical protein ALI144C_31900 [Actinosynnema sp. ALI-1.44]|uniref:MalY/PatB family protein n=1 Tax=Actinosynnema sp. ALI-1.44 TaxID=1933779 RepID=UPI00097CAFE4|nr:aminotransferase class I/II-fold pyridoxal phosphate-dependent enzyme [Actinosynnema sp. ALI-1.44]ONI77997.1 hypothetical protein ALI144C_31900 [Actinosynnema sp. ALI-1.44]
MDSRLFDNVRIDTLAQRRTLKWGKHGVATLGAWVAEMDFDLAPAIRHALHEAVERGETGYPLRDIRTGVPEACADWLATTLAWQVPAEQIFLIPDVVTGLGLGIEFYSVPGSAVVVPTPAYPPFFEVVAAAGRQLVEIPMTQGNALDLDRIDAALAAGAGTLLLCNPHNPLGHVFSRTELLELCDIVTARSARVIADEVHGPLTYPGARYIPYASVSPAAAAHTLTLISASKAWNVAGLKCCQVILTNAPDVKRWREIPFHARHGASTLGIVANLAAYTAGDPWRQGLIAYLDGNRHYLADTLPQVLPGVGLRPPDATYLAWLDCRQLGMDHPAGYFLRHAGVALSDGAVFGAPGRGFARLNFATSRAILTRIVDAMAESAHIKQ